MQQGRRRLLHARPTSWTTSSRQTVGKLLEGKTTRPAGRRQRAAHSRPGLRLRLVPDRRVPVPAGLAPRPVSGRRPGTVGQQAHAAHLPEPARRLAADHRRAQAHPAEQHLRRGHRPAGGGGDQALAAAEGAGRRGRSRRWASSWRSSRSGCCPTWPATSSAATRLIGPDFYDGQQLALLDEDERAADQRLRLAAAEFPARVDGRRGGFDAVIGNPPYIRIQTMKEWAPVEVEFYKQRYRAASKGNYDIYVVFVEKGLSLLNERGRLGFILPHKFFNAEVRRAAARPDRRGPAPGRRRALRRPAGLRRRDDVHLPAVSGEAGRASRSTSSRRTIWKRGDRGGASRR